MARHEIDREDLLREATALTPRVEWRLLSEQNTIFAGLKRDGSLSVYFGPDEVYQFNRLGQLRRAYVSGYLYRTQGTTLARLHRERDDTQTALVRTDLDDAQLNLFLTQMRCRMSGLREALLIGTAKVERSVADGPLPDFRALIQQILTVIPPLAPPIPTRR